MVRKMIFAITTVMDQLTNPINISTKAIIKKTANQEGEKLYKKRLILIKKATPYPLEQVLPLIKLLKTHPKLLYKQAACVLAIAYATGGRIGEIMELRWEDVQKECTKAGQFIRMYVRAGKTNKIPSKNEQLTAALGGDKAIEVDQWLKFWIEVSGNSNGRLFPGVPQATAKMVYRWNAIAEKHQMAMKLGAHSARNYCVLQCFEAGVPIESMRSYFRWSINSPMPAYYRSMHLETSKTGAALLLDLGKFKK